MPGSLRRVVSVLAHCGTFVGLAYTALATVRTRRFRQRASTTRAAARPPVTLLKPLHGDEPDLYANLSSFCTQAYPHYQVVFGAADPEDPALEVARRVQRAHPRCDIDIVSGMAPPTPNPKVGNLLGMIPRARHELLVIADSDIHVGPDYLEAVAGCFADPDVGAATCIPGGTPDGTLASCLGAMFLNEQFAPSVLVALALEPLTYCFGPTMAVRADVLERIGGLQALAEHLGDDYLLGRLVTQAGYRVALCPYVVHASITDHTLRALWVHELRWARTIRVSRPAGYAGSIVTYVLPFAGLLALASRSPFTGGLAVAGAVALRALLHEEARRTFAPHVQATPWLIPLRDALGVAVWCAGLLGERVTWRAGSYTVTPDGRLETG